jgi:hypothetical protein
VVEFRNPIGSAFEKGGVTSLSALLVFICTCGGARLRYVEHIDKAEF